jgi:hypothetical protein
MGDLMAVVWWDEKDIHMLTNIYNPPADINFYDDEIYVIKPHFSEEYRHHMVYVEKGDRMAVATQSATTQGNRQKIVLLSIRYGYSQQLHFSFFVW